MEKLETLIQKYPSLYSDTRPAYGFECGDGWYDIIDRLSAVAVEEFALLKKEDPELDPMVLQVKEKFGGLRFYTSQTTPRLNEAIIAAEGESTKRCEACGEATRTSDDNGWWVTLCRKHLAERRQLLRRDA